MSLFKMDSALNLPVTLSIIGLLVVLTNIIVQAVKKVTWGKLPTNTWPLLYGQIKQDISVILRKLRRQKGAEIVEAKACPDHISVLVSIPPKYSVSRIMGYLKGKSGLMIFDRNANLKYKCGNRHFWAKGYYVDTVGRNKKQIAEYIPKST